MLTRREAVRRLGLAAAGAMAAGGLACSADAGEAGAGAAAESTGSTARGTEGAAGGLGVLGIQLYTLRGEMQRHVAETLTGVAEIGYREVEFAGYFGHSPSEIREMLDATGLSAPAAHFGIDSTLDGLPASIEMAATVGHENLVVAWIPQGMRQTLDDWRRTADLFNRAGEACKAAGIQFAYHNHDFEFERIGGQVPFDVLCEEADPELVKIELDLFWIIHGGGDPFDYFARYPGRYPLVHVKDRLADGTMVDVGDGAIDFAGIFSRSEQAGIRHYFVEHDQPDDALESIRRSQGHLEGMMIGK